MTNLGRRGFMAMLAAVTLDPEKLLWVPGEKKIFIPPVVRIKAPRSLQTYWSMLPSASEARRALTSIRTSDDAFLWKARA